ncbi:4-oxalocrotonate tautomerase [Methanocalculus taiwanensis]|uniref:4-oxalocrotonate tautomerase n=1 Tax=Methanocalculus taiwanensis TaxID=106207 RepID=A0ABD4TM61_9EURY|nr:tautomerase family protein [Methanocalculus taiwanensis]MCQ1538930.1 4-oxalocrotonate tautomerase [Methanocalculus taiwanensis]
MPIITIQMSEGKTIEQKRTVAAEITKTITDTFGVEPSAITILFHELPRDNIAKSGKLLSD